MSKTHEIAGTPNTGNSSLGGVSKRFLIYADDYITWNEDKNDWNHSAEFTGTYLNAHEYARSLYGKKYTLNGA